MLFCGYKILRICEIREILHPSNSIGSSVSLLTAVPKCLRVLFFRVEKKYLIQVSSTGSVFREIYIKCGCLKYNEDKSLYFAVRTAFSPCNWRQEIKKCE